MDARDFRRHQRDGRLARQLDPLMEHLTKLGRTKKGWLQVTQSMFALKDVDFTKAKPECDRCNGTGVLRHAKIGGVLTTIVCSCLFDEEETENRRE